MEGVARPDGVLLEGVLAPSAMGLRLELWRTCGEKETAVGATRAVTVVAGTYVGTEAAAGLVGVDGGVTRAGGGDAAGVWVIGDTTFTGLWGLGVTKGGGALTAGEEGRAEVTFGASSAEDGGMGAAPILDGGEAAGGGASFGEAEVEVMEVTGILGALFWAGRSGGTVTEEVTTGSDGAGTVFTTATAGGAPPPVKHKYRLNTHVRFQPLLLTHPVRILKGNFVVFLETDLTFVGCA